MSINQKGNDMKLLFAIVALTALAGCTDTTLSSFEALGKPGQITCYSGDKVIYSGTSTGKIMTVDRSDGWEFRDAADGHFVRVSGPCVIKN